MVVFKKAATAAAVLMLGSQWASAGETRLSGTWVIGDGAGVLRIHGSTWTHPKHGAATIQKGTGASNYEVFYNEHQGVRCAYRVLTIAEGQILVLESADSSQPADFCPQGKLSRAD